jgi:hypothetical protein
MILLLERLVQICWIVQFDDDRIDVIFSFVVEEQTIVKKDIFLHLAAVGREGI